MNTVEIIKKKRDRKHLTESEIDFLIRTYTKGEIPDYQFSAFLMAGFINGFNLEETSALTNSMLNSGKIILLDSITEMKIDKHSTGGVGDKTSLIIAPIAAAAGVYVPMISGRGLGHTGGTLDKLESIPGFNTSLTLKKYESVLSKTKAVLIGQTKEIAPADKLIYALRDVTGTVESIPLITASIMSKKLAEGIDGLVLDVKTGSGAFMKEYGSAKKLAESLLNTAKSFNKKSIAFITDMDQPLGKYIGNWLEVVESINILKSGEDSDLLELSLHLAGAMIYLANKSESIEEGIEISKQLIKTGKAFDKLVEIVKAQSGDTSYLKNPDKYPKAKFHEKAVSEVDGYIKEIDNYEIGMASLELGAGRSTKEDKIDPKAGLIFHKKIGDKTFKGEVIAEIFTDKKDKIESVKNKIMKAITHSETKVKKNKLILETIKN